MWPHSLWGRAESAPRRRSTSPLMGQTGPWLRNSGLTCRDLIVNGLMTLYRPQVTTLSKYEKRLLTNVNSILPWYWTKYDTYKAMTTDQTTYRNQRTFNPIFNYYHTNQTHDLDTVTDWLPNSGKPQKDLNSFSKRATVGETQILLGHLGTQSLYVSPGTLHKCAYRYRNVAMH